MWRTISKVIWPCIFYFPWKEQYQRWSDNVFFIFPNKNNIKGDLKMYSRCHFVMRLLSWAPRSGGPGPGHNDLWNFFFSLIRDCVKASKQVQNLYPVQMLSGSPTLLRVGEPDYWSVSCPNFYRTQVYMGSNLWIRVSLTYQTFG